MGRGPARADSIYPYARYRRKRGPAIRNGKPRRTITFSRGLDRQIDREAARRGWGFARMVNHLCEASIEGIE